MARARRRVVITGIGAITPIGSGVEGLWAGVRRGVSAVGPLRRFDASRFPSRVSAEVRDFDPADYMDARRARRLDRFSQLSVAASRQALEDAAMLGAARGYPVAVYLGSALGGIAFAEEQHQRFVGGGLHAVEPTLALSVFGGAGATNVAIEFGLTGPSLGNANSCASGLIAIGEAFRLIRAGGATVALAGGAEAPLAPLTFGAFARIRALSTRDDAPAAASRPFDRGRDGFVMAEGATMLALEELGHALARGRRPYAEVVGYGATNDASNMVVPLPGGEQAARAMALALVDARLGARAVDYVNAHATATTLGDAAEAAAIRLALGGRGERVPVSATKGLHGHALGASGAFEAAIAALAIDRSWIPPTVNLDNPDTACSLAHVRGAGLDRTIDVALTNSFGFGGINACVALRRWRA